ncbi:MAG: cytochrome c [Burkholderiales bacterium]|nr:cytochrome c [Burkholderiales bacterium]
MPCKTIYRSLAAAALFSAVLPTLASAVIYNGSVDAGRVTFASNCASCHGTPPNNLILPIVMNGANNPTLISNTIRSNPSMEFLQGSLSQTDINNIAVYLAKPTTTDSDRIFDWGQATYPTLLTPAATSGSASGYYYRYYSGTNFYVGTKAGSLYLLDGSTGALSNLGAVSTWLNSAINAGF